MCTCSMVVEVECTVVSQYPNRFKKEKSIEILVLMKVE